MTIDVNVNVSSKHRIIVVFTFGTRCSSISATASARNRVFGFCSYFSEELIMRPLSPKLNSNGSGLCWAGNLIPPAMNASSSRPFRCRDVRAISTRIKPKRLRE